MQRREHSVNIKPWAPEMRAASKRAAEEQPQSEENGVHPQSNATGERRVRSLSELTGGELVSHGERTSYVEATAAAEMERLLARAARRCARSTGARWQRVYHTPSPNATQVHSVSADEEAEPNAARAATPASTQVFVDPALEAE